MEKKYTKLEGFYGVSIEDVMDILSMHNKHNNLVCVEFNGQMLYSDIDDIDSAFKKITGVTKAEHDSIIAEIDRKRKEEEESYKNNTPNLIIEWIEKGNKILDEEYREYWAKIVPIRLSDLYHGMELGCCLEIVDALNNGVHLDEAKSIIENQCHSGMSFGLVKSMVKAFCKRGKDFFQYV